MAHLTINEIHEIFNNASPKVVNFADKFVSDFLAQLKINYSLDNQRDKKALWSFFWHKVGKCFITLLSDLGLKTFDDLTMLLGDHITLMNKFTKNNNITSRESELRREYEEWKSQLEAQGTYSGLRQYDTCDPYVDDDMLGRAFVIYDGKDVDNLDKAMVFYVTGKTTNKTVKTIMNMYKMEWSKLNGISYLHANPCLVPHYWELTA